MNLGEGRTKCYWLQPTGTYRVGLRRFTHSEAGAHGHDADTITLTELPVVYEELECENQDGMKMLAGVPDSVVPAIDDERWPTVCEECGEPIPESAERQAFSALGYVRSDTGATIWTRHVHGKELAGALYDAPWLHEYERLWENDERFVGPDGIALIAVCPDGHPWQVDGKATGGGYWTRTGDPRNPSTLTVSPSILIGGSYHGFLGSSGVEPGWFSAHIG